jgi:hypothetical protein
MTLTEISNIKYGDRILWQPTYREIGTWLLVKSVEIRKSAWTAIVVDLSGNTIEDFARNFK